MGNCWSRCWALLRKETNRIKIGGGSKYFKAVGDHYTVEFENLVESEEEPSPGGCPRAISEEEMAHLKEQHYAAISDKQTLIDERLRAELAAQEEKLRREEEAECTAQREAARRVRERRQQEQLHKINSTAVVGNHEDPQAMPVAQRSTGNSVQDAKQVQPAALRSSSINAGSSHDSASRGQPFLTADGTSRDLEWYEEEALAEPVQETSVSRDGGTSLEWENDFVSARAEDCSDPEFDGFVNPVLDAPSWGSDRQDRQTDPSG